MHSNICQHDIRESGYFPVFGGGVAAGVLTCTVKAIARHSGKTVDTLPSERCALMRCCSVPREPRAMTMQVWS